MANAPGHVNVRSDIVDGNLIFRDAAGNVIGVQHGAVGAQHGWALSTRRRFTIAQVNAGATILPAAPGLKYRLVSCRAIAVGGAVGATTTVDILATQSASGVKLVAYAQASMTENAVLTDGDAASAVLAGGASYVPNDVNTAVTIGKTGSDLTTATHVDVILNFAIEA